jgi:hypothetical protein
LAVSRSPLVLDESLGRFDLSPARRHQRHDVIVDAEGESVMKKLNFAAPIICLLLPLSPAMGATASDAIGDFLPGYVGPQLADLDVKSFSVNYNNATSIFTLSASMAGAIVPGSAGFYVIGVNTGTGVLAPFGAIGQPNVIFNQAITVRKDGTGNIGATVLDPSLISIIGDTFSVNVALSLLPSTGFTPDKYGFNLWPRTANGNQFISDFAPENATLAAGVPEAATWAMMIAGLAAVGAGMRRSRREAIAFS